MNGQTKTEFLCKNWSLLLKKRLYIQCNFELVTLDLVATCDLVTIFQKPFFNLLHEIIGFSDIMGFGTVFAETKSVTKWRLHCTNDSTKVEIPHLRVQTSERLLLLYRLEALIDLRFKKICT